MASLFGGQPKVIPEFTGLQVNTSVQVLPIPIIYGAPRVSINLIYYNGFEAKKVSTGGGKGLLSGGKNQEIEYFATIMMGIAEGPLQQTYIIYQDANVFTPFDYPTNGTAFFAGTPGQSPWSVIQDTWPADARSYPYTAYYGFNNAQLDSSATVPQIDLVISGFYSGTCPLNDDTIQITTGQYDNNGNPLSFIGNIHLGTLDADPALCIFDFLTNWRYGATFPAQWVDTSSLFTDVNGYIPGIGDPSVSSFCQAVGLGWSVVLNNAETASSILERWCKNLNVAIVWNGSLLQFIPYWDRYVGTNPGWSPISGIPQKFYQPLTQSIVAITLDDILQSDGKDADPITFSRKDPQEVYNTVRVDFRDRHNFYNDVPAEVKDEAHIELYGPRIDNIGDANEFSLQNYGAVSATLQLRRNISVLREFTWKMSPLWAWIAPMYIITIPDPTNYANNITVRVTSVEDDEDENCTITAEEFPLGSASPTVLPMSATTPPDQGAVNSPPDSIYPPVVFEPTATLLTALGYATPIFVFGTSGGAAGTLDPNWGGCNIWISLDGVNYEKVGQLVGPSTYGVTTTFLSPFNGTNPDTVDSLTVFLGASGAALGSSSSAAAAAGQSACVVVDGNGYEIFSYTTATLTGPNSYTLTGLYRGLYGTPPRAFNASSLFCFVGTNANIVGENLPAAYIGQNFFVKGQSFNTFESVIQDLSECVAYEYFVTGSGAGGQLLLSDSATSSDQFVVPGEAFGLIVDSVASSDSYTPSLVLNASISETSATSDVFTP